MCCSVVQCRRAIYVVSRQTVVRRSPVVCVGIVVRRVASSSVTELSLMMTTSYVNSVHVRLRHVLLLLLLLSVALLNCRLLTVEPCSHLPVPTNHLPMISLLSDAHWLNHIHAFTSQLNTRYALIANIMSICRTSTGQRYWSSSPQSDWHLISI